MVHLSFIFFFFNDTATTEIYTHSLHDALPIEDCEGPQRAGQRIEVREDKLRENQHRRDRINEEVEEFGCAPDDDARSEEHTSELQSRLHLVCRLLLEKKKKRQSKTTEQVRHRR